MKIRRSIPIYMVGFFLAFICLPASLNALVKCNKDVLNNFYLTGLDNSIYEPMHVCPHVHDKCCSIGDEVKIKHLFENHTAPTLERRVAFVMRGIGSTVEGFMDLMDIDPSMMVVSYSVPRKVLYKEKFCSHINRVAPSKKEVDAFKVYQKGAEKYLRKKHKKKKNKKKKTKKTKKKKE